jgi:hypothetical protein
VARISQSRRSSGSPDSASSRSRCFWSISSCSAARSAGSPSRPARAAAEGGPRQLRPPAADFVGREDVLRELLEHFDRGVAVSGVRGQGGVGKTQLALKLASRLAPR